MESKVRAYIEEHNLLKDKQIVLVGLSGGADSVSLVIVLQKLGYQVVAAHCNFHLRGEESNRDEDFVTRFCAERSIPLHKAAFNTSLTAKEQGISIEMAARDLRYNFFRELMDSEKISKLAVAHHQDDQAETILINLIRGTGIHGLRGMLPKHHNIVRPLLCVSREEILSYLREENQAFVIDSTNLSAEYMRNIIRLEVIPKLKTLNPSIVCTLNDTSVYLRQAEQLYNTRLKELIDKTIINDEYRLGETEITLERLNLPMKSEEMKAVWHEILSAYGYNSSQIQDFICLPNDCKGKVFHSKLFSLHVFNDKAFITFRNINLSESITITNTDNKILFNNVILEISKIPSSAYELIEKSSSIALLDADKLTFPLTLRYVHQGDKFTPFGMKGKKLLSDFLTNLKITPVEKKEQLVLCDNTGEILWVVGRRISNNFCLTKTTKSICRIALLTNKNLYTT